MSDIAAVPLVVVSSSRDPVEALNSLLRRKGVPAHCTWIPAVQDLPDALEQLNPRTAVLRDRTTAASCGRWRRCATSVAAGCAAAGDPFRNSPKRPSRRTWRCGARDSLSLDCPERVHAVIARELKAYRIERALRDTLHVRTGLPRAAGDRADAIATTRSPRCRKASWSRPTASWLDLIGAPDARAVVGQPVMDLLRRSQPCGAEGRAGGLPAGSLERPFAARRAC